MLTDRDREAIRAAVRRYPTRRAAAVEALQAVQANHGWISDEDLEAAAWLLGMTATELDGVASFYSLLFRKPVGRHVILVCDSISCWIMGHDRVLEHLVARLGIRPGETDAAGRFTLLPVACLGHCDHAPAMMIDGELFGDLDPGRIDAALELYK